MKLIRRYRQLTVWNKIALWGSVASILGLLLTLCISVLPLRPHIKPVRSTDLKSGHDTAQAGKSSVPKSDVFSVRYLDEDQKRRQIDVLLQQGNPEKAFNILKEMEHGQGKEEECERLFSYSIKNQNLDVASMVANKCWDGIKREKALKEIALERLKQGS